LPPASTPTAVSSSARRSPPRTPAKDKRPTLLRAVMAELACEKNFRVVGRAVKDVDHNDPLSLNAVENQITAMNPAANAMAFIARHHREACRRVCQFQGTDPKLLNEG